MESHRVFIDEAGDHTTNHPEATGKRYLGLTGVIFSPDSHRTFTAKLNGLKQDHFPNYKGKSPLILHREDIVQKRGAFGLLCDEGKCKAFDEELLGLISATDFRIIAVSLDKATHFPKTYRRMRHPYHYALLALLERYCLFLDMVCMRGDVMAESRGAKEDRSLKESYSGTFKSGGYYLPKSKIDRTLTSGEIKIKKKEANIAGLQLADLLAHPLTRDVLFAYGRQGSRGGPFADKIAQVVRPKYVTKPGGDRIMGYGQVILG